MIPVLETARLRLRAHRPGDLDACTAMWADPAVTRFIGGKPSTRSQTWSRILAYGGHWAFMGFGYWAIELRDSGEFAGEAGFADFKRDIADSMRGVPELGFAFAPQYHGQGFASEAVAAVVAWGDAHLDARRTVALIDAANAPSRRVVEKSGYRIFRQGPYNGTQAVFAERIAKEPE